MKKKWIEYLSEEGSFWEFFVNDSYQEKEEDCVSNTGEYAIMKRVMNTIDLVEVSITPAARIVDDAKSQIGRTNLYYIALSLINGDDWFCISNKSYSKEEIIKISIFFIGLNKKQAERVWISKKLGNINTDRLDR